MSKELGHFTLGEHATFRNGLNFSKESRGRGCLLVGVPDFQERFSPAYESLSEINPEGIARANDYLQQGDIVFVRSNGNKALVGRSLYIDKEVEALFSGFCIRARLTSSEINKRFFAYFTKTASFKSQIASSAGTNINNLNQDILSQVKVPAFAKKYQEKIAAVLSTLDAKIDCNNRINAELEAMSKTLYNYWFVQFDFPDANGKPYKSSGGKMVYNATLKREVPEGWDVILLNDLFQNPNDSISASNVSSETPYTPIDSLPMKKMSFGAAQPASKANTSLIQYKEGDILIGAMRVYFHRVCIAPFDGITRTTTLVLRPKKQNNLPYLYQVCNEDRTIIVAKKISVGTQQPYVNWEDSLENYSIAYPDDDALVQEYSSKMNSAVQEVIIRERENQQLAQLRDWLLPLLMNGQVTVA